MFWLLYFVDLATAGESARASFATSVPVNKYSNLNTSFISIDHYSVVMEQVELFG